MEIKQYDTKEKVYEFLQKHAIAVISTVSEDNIPSGAPIYFVSDPDLNIYFITKSDTTKAQNIEKSDHKGIVSITVFDQRVPIAVQARGKVTENYDPQYISKFAEANAFQRAGFHWPPPLSQLEGEGKVLLYKFIPEWLRIADFSGVENHSPVFHQIIP